MFLLDRDPLKKKKKQNETEIFCQKIKSEELRCFTWKSKCKEKTTNMTHPR